MDTILEQIQKELIRINDRGGRVLIGQRLVTYEVWEGGRRHHWIQRTSLEDILRYLETQRTTSERKAKTQED